MSKQCNTCGTSNESNARFCSQCGEEFPEEQEKKCSECQTVNSPDAKFCLNCGSALILAKRNIQPKEMRQHSYRAQERQKQKESRKSSQKSSYPVLLFAAAAGLVIFVSVYFNNGSIPQTSIQTVQVAEQKSNDQALEAKVKVVASRFICSCGTCGEQSLDTCTCGNAVQQRQFIRMHLQAGQSEEQVILAVNTTYGWMKKEFTTQYDSLARKKGVSMKVTLPTDIQSGPLTANSVVEKAGANNLRVNREEVFSHFRCPCGKCGMDDLKTCECTHPRGAKEVKAFVDAKIAINQFSTDQIIAIVAQTYGGRKF